MRLHGILADPPTHPPTHASIAPSRPTHPYTQGEGGPRGGVLRPPTPHPSGAELLKGPLMEGGGGSQSLVYRPCQETTRHLDRMKALEL